MLVNNGLDKYGLDMDDFVKYDLNKSGLDKHGLGEYNFVNYVAKHGLNKQSFDKHGLVKQGLVKYVLDMVLIWFWNTLSVVLDWLSILLCM